MEKRAIITGGTGFVGSHLALGLAKNKWDVSLIVRSQSSREQFQSAPWLEYQNNFKFYEFGGETRQLIDIVSDAKPSIGFHLASFFRAEHESEDVVPMLNSNCLYATQFAEALVQSGVKTLVNTGTAWQHFEDADYNPVCLYAASKQAFEDILKYYSEANNLKLITLKLFDTYGPFDPRAKLFHLLRTFSRSGELLEMSKGEQLIDLVYIDDVVNAFIKAADLILSEDFAGAAEYALSSASPITLKNLVEEYQKVLTKKLKVDFGPRAYREREVMTPWTKGQVLPGWLPQINLEQGLKLMEQGPGGLLSE